jgi:predicted DNA-binding transcriptional regulator AlpA
MITATTSPTRSRRQHAPLPLDFADPHAQDKLAGPQVAASALGIGVSTLFKHVAAGRIAPPTKIGRLSKWRYAYIRQLAAEGLDNSALA